MPYIRPQSSLGLVPPYSNRHKISLENLSIGKKNSFANVISWSSKFKEETSLIKKYSDTLNNFNYYNKSISKSNINYDLIVESLKKQNESLKNQLSIHQKKNDELQQKINDTNLCEICFENKKNILCIPCNHISICSSCLPHIHSKCPICRTQVTQTKKVYL